MTGPTIEFVKLSKHFSETVAVDAVNLKIAGGSLVALVGTSGSGKSTLLKMINRLVLPSEGQVLINDADTANRDAHDLRRSIGYVFQNIGLFPHMNVGRNITIGLELAGSDEDQSKRVSELLELVDLPPEFASRMPDELSGGQQQRVGVARALATRPGLMLMDEPFGALDPVTRERLVREYRQLHDRLGLTTIIVTHDMAEALTLADRVLVMQGGKIVADATAAQMIAGDGGEAAEELVAVPRQQARHLLGLADK